MALIKYNYGFLFILDFICYIMTYPWFAMLSLFVSCFHTTTEERKYPHRKYLQYFIYAPILGLILISTLPFTILGYFSWIIICNLFNIPDYAILSYPEPTE